MYPISMRGFAEVSSAPPDRKASKLKKYKFRQSDESKARSNYYIKALAAIKRHHRGDSTAVAAAIKELLAASVTEPTNLKRAKAANNLRALTDYLKYFGHRVLNIQRGARLYYSYKDLLVSSQPDLVAEESGKLVLIKLNLTQEDYKGGVAGTMLHVLSEAAKMKGLPVGTEQVEYLQVSDGTRIVGPKTGFGPVSQLENRSEELIALWPSVA